MEDVPPNLPMWRDMALRRPRSPYSRLPRALARVSFHVPIRPNWICAGCGAPWPCSTRRSHLLAEFDRAPVSLALYMAGYFLDCCADLPNQPAGELYQRFMGWLGGQARSHDDQKP